jgi:hypothetical protein
VTVVCPGPIETSNDARIKTSEKKGSSEVSSCHNVTYYINTIILFLAIVGSLPTNCTISSKLELVRGWILSFIG